MPLADPFLQSTLSSQGSLPSPQVGSSQEQQPGPACLPSQNRHNNSGLILLDTQKPVPGKPSLPGHAESSLLPAQDPLLPLQSAQKPPESLQTHGAALPPVRTQNPPVLSEVSPAVAASGLLDGATAGVEDMTEDQSEEARLEAELAQLAGFDCRPGILDSLLARYNQVLDCTVVPVVSCCELFSLAAPPRSRPPSW